MGRSWNSVIPNVIGGVLNRTQRWRSLVFYKYVLIKNGSWDETNRPTKRILIQPARRFYMSPNQILKFQFATKKNSRFNLLEL